MANYRSNSVYRSARNYRGSTNQNISPNGFLTVAFGDASVFTRQFISVTGFTNATYGTALIYNASLLPSGLLATRYGTPTIANVSFPQTLHPSGFTNLGFGTAVLSRPPHDDLGPSGFLATAYGSPTVNQQRFLKPFGFNASTVPNPYQVSWRKFVTPSGYVAVGFGAQQLQNQNRTLQFSGFNAVRFGTTDLQHKNRTITAVGFTQSSAGALAVSLRVRTVAPFGYTVPGYGIAHIFNYDPTQHINVPSLFAIVWGEAFVDQTIKILRPSGIVSSEGFGHFNDVANRNRTIHASGFTFGKYGVPNAEEVGAPITLRPAAIIPRGIGDPLVALKVRQITPSGFYSTAFSNFNAIAWDETNQIRPGGIARPEIQFGQPSLRNYSTFARPAGFITLRMGDAVVMYRNRPIAPVGFDAASSGTGGRVEHQLRFINTTTLGTGGVGDASIQFKNRYVETIGSITVRFGKPTMGFERRLLPAGLDPLGFGKANVHDNSQTIDLRFQGITGAFGETSVGLYRRTLKQSTTPDQSYVSTKATVWNTRQYIKPYTDTAVTWGPYFGHYNDVANRNRYIGPTGFNAAKVPITALLENAGRAIRPVGSEMFKSGNGGMVAYRIRNVYPDAIEPGLSLRWHVVYNNARVLAPRGYDASLYGTAALANKNRTIKHHSGYVGPSWGTPYADFAIRTLSFYSGITPPPLGLLKIQNSTQYIKPTGFKWVDETGAHDVFGHRNIIGPTRMVLQTKYGEHRVWNKTPELGAYGHDSQEYGNTKVRLQFRFVNAISGSTMTQWGKPLVRDRRTWVYNNGFNAGRIGLQRVALANPDLPWPRTILANGLAATLMGGASVRSNSIYPVGIKVDGYGSPTVKYYGIMPDSILPAANFAEQFGIPFVNPRLFINPNGINPIMPSRTDAGTLFDGGGPTKHRIDPPTIWCTTSAPTQAKANNGFRIWELMDARFSPENPARPFFGAMRIELKNRRMTVFSPAPMGGIGAHGIQLRKRYIQPTGLKSFKYGVPELFGGLRLFQFYGFDMSLFGQPNVDYYVKPLTNRTVRPSGAVGFAAGATRVELKNRKVNPVGYLASISPAPQVSRAPRFITPAGFVGTNYGTTWVSMRVRSVQTIGADTSIISYSIGDFSLRMRVWHRDRIVGPTLGKLTAYGTQRVSLKRQVIKQTDEIQRGAVGHPGLLKRNIIALGGLGFDAGAFGDVDRWEAGKIKAHGDDLLRCGVPRIGRGINTSGNVGVVGQPSIAQPIAPSGFGGVTFGLVSTPLRNPHGCGQTARAVVPGAFVPPAFGTPKVT